MDFKCGVDVVVKPNFKELTFKKFYSTSRMDISKSGKYMVRSGLYKIFLTEFETNKRINAVKGYGYIINGISENDDFCVFTSNGERRINILSIPDLKEVAWLDVDYVTNLKFSSDSEIMYFSRKPGAREYSLNIWNFLTGETKTVFDNSKDGFVAISQHFDCDSICLFSCYCDNFRRGKLRILSRTGVSEYSINGKYNFNNVSQPNNNKILISKFLKDEKYVIGIYDLSTETFIPIIKRENFPKFLFWLSDNLFLFSEQEKAGVSPQQTGIMNLKGEILTLVDDFTLLAPCSNDKYLLCYNPGGTYLFEKVFEHQSPITRRFETTEKV